MDFSAWYQQMYISQQTGTWPVSVSPIVSHSKEIEKKVLRQQLFSSYLFYIPSMKIQSVKLWNENVDFNFKAAPDGAGWWGRGERDGLVAACFVTLPERFKRKESICSGGCMTCIKQDTWIRQRNNCGFWGRLFEENHGPTHGLYCHSRPYHFLVLLILWCLRAGWQ